MTKISSIKYYTEIQRYGPRTIGDWLVAKMPLFDKDRRNTVASARSMPAHRWLGVKWLNERESHGMGQLFRQTTGSMGAEPHVQDPNLPHCLAPVWTTPPHGRRDKGVCQLREVAAGWSYGQFQSSVHAVIFLDELDVPLSKELMNQ